jgi:hypothetical protein
VAARGSRCTKEVEELKARGTCCEIVCRAPPLGSHYIVGKGCTLPLPQVTKDGGDEEEQGRRRTGLGPAVPLPQTLTLAGQGLGPMAP